MSPLRKGIVMMALCLILGGTGASAAEMSSSHIDREPNAIARILDHLSAFFKVVWQAEGYQIDPWGGSSSGTGGPADDGTATPSSDEGFEIDPWG